MNDDDHNYDKDKPYGGDRCSVCGVRKTHLMRLFDVRTGKSRAYCEAHDPSADSVWGPLTE